MFDWVPDGIIYGLIDNGVLAFSTLLGIDIDRYFKGKIYNIRLSFNDALLN